MANVGRVEDPRETSLAAATAAIITARWNAVARMPKQRRPAPEPPPRPAGPAVGAAPVRGSAAVPGLVRPYTNGNGPGQTTEPAPVAPAPVAPAPVPPPPMFTAATANAAPDLFASDTGPEAIAPPMPAPSMPARPGREAFTVPGPRAPSEPSALDKPLPPEDFSFAGSVMSDLAFPEPFIPEPYDPNTFIPNGLGDDSPVTPPEESAGEMDPLDIDTEPMLPRRVPAVPDVPDDLLSPNEQDPADGFELSRIAHYLRDDKVDASDRRPDGFDMLAVVQAVRGVPDVSDAQLRWTPGYGHTLRIEFVDGADEEQVTRQVARLLRETMGLAAQPGPPSLPAARVSSEEATLDRPKRLDRPVRQRVLASAPAPAHPARPEAVAAPAAPAAPGTARGGHPLPPPRRDGGGGLCRVVLDHVQVTTLGLDATVEVRIAVSGGPSAGASAVGKGHGPAVDAYLLRLAANAAGNAVDQVLVDRATGTSRGRCFIEHVAVVPFAGCEVAVVVLLLVSGSLAEQHAGSAIVAGDPRQAVVRATLSAVNRRLESLLS